MLSVLITADFCPNERIINLVEKVDYNTIFNDFVDEIQSSDLSITNLECPIIEDIKAFDERIEKIGPSLSTTPKAVDVLKKAGFNLLTLANNHIMDYGPYGLNTTIKHIKSAHMDFVGAGVDLSEARKPFFFSKNGITIGIINIAENEFSTTKGKESGANPLDIIKNYHDIQKCKESCDKIILIYHGGSEGFQYPTPRMKELFRHYVDLGVDAVISHHTHCFSGFEIYKGKHIFYGLGNFVFDWKNIRNNKWNYGYAVRLNFDNQNQNYEIIPYIQNNNIAGVHKLHGKDKKDFFVQIEQINNIIDNDSLLEKEFSKLISEREDEYFFVLQPYNNRILNALYRRKLIPGIWSKSKKTFLLNCIRCESHRDLMMGALN